MRLVFCIVFILFLVLLCSSGGYQVFIDGIADKKLAQTFLQSSSSYVKRNDPLTSLSELKARAKADSEKLTDLAHYHGYYLAKVSYVFSASPKFSVHFQVDLGPKFSLNRLTLIPDADVPKLEKGQDISTQAILDYEKSLLTNLQKKGFAKAIITKREVVADAQTHTLDIHFYLDPGPQAVFGPLYLFGNKSVLRETIHKYIGWKEGDPYDPVKVEKAENDLEKSGLFTSVIISQDELEENVLPVTLNVQEAKHKSIGFGLSYTTTWGPGITAEWENRNLRGLADTLAFRTEIWQRYQTASLSLTRHQDKQKDVDLIWLLEYNKLHTLPFDCRSLSVSRLLQKKISVGREVNYGVRLEWLHAKNFDSDKTYYLIKIPLQFKMSSADNFLDPRSGQTLSIKVTPTAQAKFPMAFYASQVTSLSSFYTLPNDLMTLAGKLVFGSFIGASEHTIPPPDRFYGGSENVLRGYKAFTVSPLHKKRIPLGGRSLLAASFETRLRSHTNIGWALFYDVGNVYSENIPKPKTHQLQSVGAGIRYNTPIGPLRFDVAIPLNRRPHIDPPFQIFFSIGQAF